MKTKTSIFKFTQGTLFACLLTIGFTTITVAAEDPRDDKELKYQCMSNDKPVFLLELNNSENAAYSVTITDRDQSVLFSETIGGKNISRSYKLDTKEPFLLSGTTFTVTNLLTKKTTAYKIRGYDMSVEKRFIIHGRHRSFSSI